MYCTQSQIKSYKAYERDGGPKESDIVVHICPGEFATNKRKKSSNLLLNVMICFFFVNLISDLPVLKT